METTTWARRDPDTGTVWDKVTNEQMAAMLRAFANPPRPAMRLERATADRVDVIDPATGARQTPYLRQRAGQPYALGETVGAMWLEPKVGTVLGKATVTKVERREDGRYRVTVEPHNSEVGERAYTVSATGHSDYLARVGQDGQYV